MKNSEILNLVKEVKKLLKKEIKEGSEFYYTCHLIGYKYGYNSKEFLWYVNMIKNLYDTDKELIDTLGEETQSGFRRRSSAPFGGYENEDRLKMLDYLIKKYKNVK